MAIQHYIVAQPTDLPISVAEAKEELELIGQAHDSKIARKISAARSIWERYTGRAAVPQQWVFVIESELAREGGRTLVGSAGAGSAQVESRIACRHTVELPKVPFVSVDKVESKDAIDEDYTEPTVDQDYRIDPQANMGRLIWNLDAALPSFRRITYTAGYNPGELPAEYQETILKLTVFGFENRGDIESKLPTSLVAELRGQSTGTNNAGYWS